MKLIKKECGNMQYKKVAVFLIFLFFLIPSHVQIQAEYISVKHNVKPGQEIFPLRIGEEFIYTINWGIIRAGSATLKVDSLVKCGDAECYKIETHTRTNSFFDKIYKVRDTIESLVETSLKRSRYYYKKQQEGKFRRNEELIFDYQKEEVNLKRNGKIKNTVKIQRDKDLLDPLSVLYYVRGMNLQIGDVVEAYVTDGNDIYLLQIDVIKRERVKTWSGYFDCLKIEPKMQNMEGIFHKKHKAKIYIWLTNDKRKIPVKIQSEVFVGSFQILLKEIRGS